MTMTEITGYVYRDPNHSCAHSNLMPTVFAELDKLSKSIKGGQDYSILVVATGAWPMLLYRKGGM